MDAPREKEVFVEAGFYNNACKFLVLVRTKKILLPPPAIRLAFLKILLDSLRRNIYVWCLKNLPEVDCQREANQQWVDGANSQACEDMNSFIHDRTVPSVEMTKGRIYVFGVHCFG